MSDRPLTVSFENIGEWFLPDRSDYVIPGTLRYDPEAISLDLLDRFAPLEAATDLTDDFPEYPIVHGTTNGGDAVTLISARRTGSSFRFASGGVRQTERLRPEFLLVGAFIPADFGFREVRFRIPGLQALLLKPLIERSFPPGEAACGQKIDIRINIPPEEVVPLPTIEAELRWGVSASADTDRYASATATTAGWVSIRCDAPQALRWFLDVEFRFRCLVTFFAGVSMPSDCVTAVVDADGHTAAVLYHSRDREFCDFTHPWLFYMPRSAMGIAFEDAVRRWFEAPAELEIPSRLAANVLSAKHQWTNLEFLALAQALEGFHRALCRGTYVDPTAYEAIRDPIVAAIPQGVAPDHRAALHARLKYGNEFSLAKRLAELAERLSATARALIIGPDGRIPRRWVDTRNYYTHWDQSLRNNILDSEGLVHANLRMRHLLRALYLNLVGVPWESIEAAAKNNCNESQFLTQVRSREARDRFA